MVRRTRADMEETRATLLKVARKVFSEQGYAETSMDDLTAMAGLTRGALYHHFGDKKGLLTAVVAQIDAEMDTRLHTLSDAAENAWEGFRDRCRMYLEMAQEPEIQRIVLRDARAVLGSSPPEAHRHCTASLQKMFKQLMLQGTVVHTDPEALAMLIHGGLCEAAFWIAEAEPGSERLVQALAALEVLLRGVRS